MKIAVYGESAGAHLASLLICAKPGECGESNSLTNEWISPCKGILHATPVDFFPWEGMMPNFWDTMQNIAGVPYEKDVECYERLSLKNYINGNNPPIFFVEAELENLFLSEHTLQLVKLITACMLRMPLNSSVFMTPNLMADSVSDEVTDSYIREIYADMIKSSENSLGKYIEEAKEICRKENVMVCDCYKIWNTLKENEVDITRLLSNRINHPTEKMYWLFAIKLIETIFKEETK